MRKISHTTAVMSEKLRKTSIILRAAPITEGRRSNLPT